MPYERMRGWRNREGSRDGQSGEMFLVRIHVRLCDRSIADSSFVFMEADPMTDMETYIAEELREDGREYAVYFEARDWPEAEAHCEAAGYTLLGIVQATIPVSEFFGEKEANELIATMNEAERSAKH